MEYYLPCNSCQGTRAVQQWLLANHICLATVNMETQLLRNGYIKLYFIIFSMLLRYRTFKDIVRHLCHLLCNLYEYQKLGQSDLNLVPIDLILYFHVVHQEAHSCMKMIVGEPYLLLKGCYGTMFSQQRLLGNHICLAMVAREPYLHSNSCQGAIFAQQRLLGNHICLATVDVCALFIVNAQHYYYYKNLQ